jgi:hypothetical protein
MIIPSATYKKHPIKLQKKIISRISPQKNISLKKTMKSLTISLQKKISLRKPMTEIILPQPKD